VLYVKYSFIWTKKCPKRLRTIFTTTHIRTSSCQHMVLTSWFKSSIFSLFFCSLGTFSCNFYIFHYFLSDWMHVTCPFQWVDYIAGVRHDWLPWISWLMHLLEPFWTPTMNFTHPGEWITYIQTVIVFFVQQYRNYQRWFRMKYNVEIDKKILSLNQTVKTIPVQQTDRFFYVSTYKKLLSFKPRIYCRLKKRL